MSESMEAFVRASQQFQQIKAWAEYLTDTAAPIRQSEIASYAPMRECDWCGARAPNDSRGACSACGGPRMQPLQVARQPETYPTYMGERITPQRTPNEIRLELGLEPMETTTPITIDVEAYRALSSAPIPPLKSAGWHWTLSDLIWIVAMAIPLGAIIGSWLHLWR